MTAAATRSDEELLEALLDGDVRGFDLLHARYERPLFAFIRRHHPQQQEAEDLLHETFLALLRDRVAARAATNLRAWLFQVARHLCLNRHRAQRRAAGALADPAVTRAPLPEPHPERILLGNERRRALGAAIANLPLELAELWHLRTSGLSYEEMARASGLMDQAYCASPLPKDQFSFFTSTRVMNTSCFRRPMRSFRPSAIAR